MTPNLLQWLMILVLLIGLRSLKEVMRKKKGILLDLLILACAFIVLFKYMMVRTFLG